MLFLYLLIALTAVAAAIFATPLRRKVWTALVLTAAGALWCSARAVGVLAVYLQERFGIRAGLVQLGFDLFVLAAAFLVAAPFIVLCSVVGAVVLNLFLTVNHRADRYIAM